MRKTAWMGRWVSEAGTRGLHYRIDTNTAGTGVRAVPETLDPLSEVFCLDMPRHGMLHIEIRRSRNDIDSGQRGLVVGADQEVEGAV